MSVYMTYLWSRLGKFPSLLCVAPIGWLIVKGVEEVAVLISSSIISKFSFCLSIISFYSSINSIATIFSNVS